MTQADASVLFRRACTVQVGPLIFSAGNGTGLDVAFEIERGIKMSGGATAKPQPNTCDLKVYNLSPDHRRQIEQSTTPGAGTTVVPVVISAGYAARASTVFSGELRGAHSTTGGPRIVTELSTGDGDQALTQKRLNFAVPKGSTAAQVLQQIVAGLGVQPGNLPKALTLLQSLPLSAKLYAQGAVLKGQASHIMTDFCRSVGLDWSIQNGALQVTALNQPTSGTAILLDSTHGLVGSPTVDTKGILSCKTLLNPDIVPGVKLSLNAKSVTGGYRVTYVKTAGDTQGNDWGHELEAVRY